MAIMLCINHTISKNKSRIAMNSSGFQSPHLAMYMI